MSKFIVGDRVRVTGGEWGEYIGKSGVVVTVEEESDDGFPYEVLFNGGLDSDWFTARELIPAVITAQEREDNG